MGVKQTLDGDEIEPDVQDRIGNEHNDLAGQTGKDSDPPKNGGMGFYNVSLDQQPFKSDQDQFNEAQYKKDPKNHTEESRKKFAPRSDTPTMASADPFQKLPEALMQADPAMMSQILPNFYKQFMQIRNLLTAFDSMNSNSKNPNANVDRSSNVAITDVFSGALAILVKRFNYYQVLTVLFNALGDNKYKNIVCMVQIVL